MSERLLRTAQRELGTKEFPPNSNRVKYNTWFYGREVSGAAYPWCMVFVQWCFNQIGAAELLPLRTASCGSLMRAAKKAGLWVEEDFRPCDVVIYDFHGNGSTDHTGIVERVTDSGVVAIEGNTSQFGSQSNGGEVCRKNRKRRQIVGAVRPRFEEDDMDISKLTDAEVLKLAERMQEVLGRRTVSPKLAAELAEAKALGVTDASNPGAFCTRAQAAVMTLRASKK